MLLYGQEPLVQGEPSESGFYAECSRGAIESSWRWKLTSTGLSSADAIPFDAIEVQLRGLEVRLRYNGRHLTISTQEQLRPGAKITARADPVATSCAG